MTIAARDVRLALLSGLELTGATASVEFESSRLELELDRLTLKHDLWSLLRGRVLINEVVLEKPRLELRPASSTAAGDRSVDRRFAGRGDRAPPAQPFEPAGEEVAIAITSWRIENGSLRIFQRATADAELEVDGITLDLRDLSFDRAAGWNGMSAAGSFRAAEIRSEGSTVGKAAAGEVLLEGGRLRLEGLELATATARLAGSRFDADLRREPFGYDLKLTGDVDLGALVGAGDGVGVGPAELVFGATGTGPEVEELSGEGTLHLAAGEIPSPPVIVQIERLLGRTILTGASYEDTEIRFRLTGNVVEVSPFELVSDDAKLGVRGFVDLEGPIDLRLQVQAPADQVRIEGTEQEILAALLDRDGWLTLPFLVRGTFEDPDVEFDWKDSEAALFDAAANAARKLLEDEGLTGATRLLNRLIEKN